MNIYWIMFAVAYMINLVSVISILFADKKEISVTIGWITVFVFLPFVGLLFYFFFGSTAKYKIFSKKYNAEILDFSYNEFLKGNIKRIEAEKLGFNEAMTAACGDLITLNAKNAASVYTSDNKVTLLTTAKDKYACLFEDIKNAEESINILYFIIKTKDSSGKRLVELLTEKAKQGIEVRLIYDRLGILYVRKSHFKKLIAAGGKVYPFLPSLYNTLIQANYRMHRKMVIIDGKIAYTGGINIGDDYLGKDPLVTPWRDTSVKITGTAVQALQLQFLKDWIYLQRQDRKNIYACNTEDKASIEKFFKVPEEKGDMGVQILSDGPDKNYTLIQDFYAKLIISAKKYIYIQTPYFAPDELLMSSLRIAAASGVDVRIMIPGVPDKKFVYYATLSHVEELLKSGVRVFMYKGFIHAKTIVADDFVTSVGTANFDIRSLKLNFEMNTVVYDETFAGENRATFFDDMTYSAEINPEEFKRRSKLQKIKEAFWRLITPLV